MAKVLCKLPNVSSEVSGVKFSPHPDLPGVKVSDEISDAMAADFTSCPGYELVGKKEAPLTGGSQGNDADALEEAELQDLRARGVAVNMPNAALMGLKRLRTEVPVAEAAANGSKPPAAPGGAASAPSGQ